MRALVRPLRSSSLPLLVCLWAFLGGWTRAQWNHSWFGGGDSQLAQKIQATMLERKEEYALKPVPKMPGGDGSDRRH